MSKINSNQTADIIQSKQSSLNQSELIQSILTSKLLCPNKNKVHFLCMNKHCKQITATKCIVSTCSFCTIHHGNCSGKILHDYNKIFKQQKQIKHNIEKLISNQSRKLVQHVQNSKTKLIKKMKSTSWLYKNKNIKNPAKDNQTQINDIKDLTSKIVFQMWQAHQSRQLKFKQKIVQEDTAKLSNSIKNKIDKHFIELENYFIKINNDVFTNEETTKEQISHKIRWNQNLKHSNLAIQGLKLKRIIAGTSHNNAFALLSPFLNQYVGQIVRWRIKILSSRSNLMIGICRKKSIMRQQFSTYNRQKNNQNGIYVYNSYGYGNSMRFAVGDILELKYDKINLKLQMVKLKTSQTSVILIDKQQKSDDKLNDEMAICVGIGSINDQIELMGKIQSYSREHVYQ